MLRRSVGRRVVFRLPESKDTLSALVLGVDPLRLQLPDGSVTFSPPGAALYPGDVVVADPTAGARARERPGAGQAAPRLLHHRRVVAGELPGLLGASEARVTGSAVIRVADAPGRGRGGAAAGGRGRAGAAARRRRCRYAEARRMAEAMAMDKMAATEQRVGEFHLYSLPGRSTLLPGLTSVGRAVRAGPGEVRAELRGARAWCRSGASCRSRATRPRRRSR